MKTLRKLFYVACTTFFLASCEETYNDKLFWPGELSQEYGSYIKPSTLDLTYSGEKLIGKTVSFQTEDSKKGTLTLNDIIPGRKRDIIPDKLIRAGRQLYVQRRNSFVRGSNCEIRRLHYSENDETGFECNDAAKSMDKNLSDERTDTRQRKRCRTQSDNRRI